MELFCLLAVRLVRFFLGCKASEGDNFSVFCYPGLPRSILKPRLEGHSLEPVNAGRLGICSILPVRGFPEVANSIVGSIFVYVVDLIFRLTPIMKRPSKSVGRVIPSKNFYVNVTAPLVDGSGHRSSLGPPPVTKPSERPRLRVVRQNFFDAIDIHAEYIAGTAMRLSSGKD